MTASEMAEVRAMVAEVRALAAEVRALVAKLDLDGERPKPAPVPAAPRTERRLYSIKEVAQLLSVNANTVYQLAYSGQLKSATVGRRRLIPSDALEDYVLGVSK